MIRKSLLAIWVGINDVIAICVRGDQDEYCFQELGYRVVALPTPSILTANDRPLSLTGKTEEN